MGTAAVADAVDGSCSDSRVDSDYDYNYDYDPRFDVLNKQTKK